MLIIKHLQRGGGYVTPNICYLEETKGLIIKPKKTKAINYIWCEIKGSNVYFYTTYPVTSNLYVSNNSIYLLFAFNIGVQQINSSLEPGQENVEIYGIGFSELEADIMALQECEDDTYIYRIKN